MDRFFVPLPERWERANRERETSSLRILFLLRCLGVGGAERQTALLAKDLISSNIPVSVFALEGGGMREGFQGARLIEAGHHPTLSPGGRWIQLAAAQLRLIVWVRRFGPQVLHALLPLPNFLGAVTGKMMRVPRIIISFRGLETHLQRHPRWWHLERMAIRWSHRVVANSRAVKEDLVRLRLCSPEKITVIHNGVDTGRFRPCGPGGEKTRRALGIGLEEHVVICVANLLPYKGHEDLIRASRLVLNRLPSARFLLVGEDRGIQRLLEALALQVGVHERTIFLGQRLDVSSLMQASDLLVLASEEEGLSNAILEAMASGLPVVATRVGGNEEAVEHGRTGWLVPPKDPGALAEKMLDLLRDPVRARQWGLQGRERVEKLFSVDRMVRSYKKLYGIGGSESS